ncbi:hypothetical protein QVD17_36014 [Tagetes erecta]|uniref:RRM domain-containing protein n=1 Tax=Tagetes erecta TaxID=13708 RepID=A0AAD8NIQ8_TARER|nr:hypothetical protein QVD17_36014 [Tagetes erecta]
MIEAIDMSLDDIIKNNKKLARSSATNSSFRGAGRVRSRGHGRDLELGPGPTRRSDNLSSTRLKPYFVPPAFDVQNMVVGGDSSSEAGTTLYISNLHCDVTNEDIKVLFSDVGEIKRYSIHYDKAGISKGTAEVVYMRQLDAVAAIKKYNNMLLDGKRMRIELVGVSIPVLAPAMQKGFSGSNLINPSRSNQGRVVGRGHVCGGTNTYHHEFEKGQGGGQNRSEKVSADDLDADLESYRLHAMRIN